MQKILLLISVILLPLFSNFADQNIEGPWARIVEKPASGSKMLGDLGAQDRNVLNIHEDPSTKSTKQIAAEVGFGENSVMCLYDLDHIHQILKTSSASYGNKNDKQFADWYDDGYQATKLLIQNVKQNTDCYYALKYYINGFANSHITLRSYIPMAQELYPGLFLTIKDDGKIIVFEKDNKIKYLKNIYIGDEVVKINDTPADQFMKRYIFPFYSNDKTQRSKKIALLHSLLIDQNNFKPIAKTLTVVGQNGMQHIELKFTKLPVSDKKRIWSLYNKQVNKKFNIESISEGVWIKIPSFYLDKDEIIFFKGMLSSLKNELAQEEYIIFDLRGNLGGKSENSTAIIRNLWGDDYIKSLGKNHDYNKTYIKKQKIIRKNPSQQQQDFIEEKWSVFNHKANLYSNRLLAKLASGSNVLGDLGAQDRSVHKVHEDPSTKSTKQIAAEVGFGEKSNKDKAPFKAKIYVLTDDLCKSTCWRFVRELRQMPGVIHLGKATAHYSIYSHAKKARTESENFDLFYPTKLWKEPVIDNIGPIIPHQIYNGDIYDETELLNWVLSITEQDIL